MNPSVWLQICTTDHYNVSKDIKKGQEERVGTHKRSPRVWFRRLKQKHRSENAEPLNKDSSNSYQKTVLPPNTCRTGTKRNGNTRRIKREAIKDTTE